MDPRQQTDPTTPRNPGPGSGLSPLLDRRRFLGTAVTAAGSLAVSPLLAQVRTGKRSFQVHAWKRDPRNPVLPPSTQGFDVGCCMNPFVVRKGDEYWLFYAGADAKGRRRIL